MTARNGLSEGASARRRPRTSRSRQAGNHAKVATCTPATGAVRSRPFGARRLRTYGDFLLLLASSVLEWDFVYNGNIRTNVTVREGDPRQRWACPVCAIANVLLDGLPATGDIAEEGAWTISAKPAVQEVSGRLRLGKWMPDSLRDRIVAAADNYTTTAQARRDRALLLQACGIEEEWRLRLL